MPNSERELPQGWAWTTLGEATHVNQRNRAIRELPDAHPVSFVPMAAVDAEAGIIAMPEQRTLGQVRKGFTPFSDRDVIMAKITPSMENGKAAIARGLTNGIGFGSTEFHVFTPTDIVLPEYVFHFVRQESFRRDAKANFAGTAGQLRVPAAFLEKYPFPLAPLPEQRRIVAKIEELFSRLDAGVAALKRVQAALKRYKASVLKAACEGRLVPQDPSDEPADVLLTRILAERRAKWEADLRVKGKDLKKAKYEEPEEPSGVHPSFLPEGWTSTTIEQLVDVGTGATPLRSRTDYYENGSIAWITSGALNELFVDKAEEFITDLAINRTNAKVFPSGSLLVAMYGEGKTRGKVSELRIAAATNQACAVLVFNGSSEKAKAFVKLFLQKNYEDIRRLSSGGVQPNLNLSIIKRTLLPLPPLPEQQRINAEVERRFTISAEIEGCLDANLARAHRLRQSILAQAFSGKLVPQDPADEPAEQLLTQIRAEGDDEPDVQAGKKPARRKSRAAA